MRFGHQAICETEVTVIDSQSTYWIVGGKADSVMASLAAAAKRGAARERVNTVNASSDLHARRGYRLASLSVLKNAS